MQPPATPMDPIWLDAPWPALHAAPAPAGAVVQANAAARRWALAAGGSESSLQALGEQSLAAAAAGPAGAHHEVQLGPVRASCHAVPLADGLLLWLQPLAPEVHDEDHLALARRVTAALGVGFWSRDLETQAMTWDAQMHRIHAWPAGQGAPSAAQWLHERAHEADREWLQARIRGADERVEPIVESEFRIRLPDGSVRCIQAWACRTERGGHRVSYGMHLDVTERKQSDALLREKQRLEAASQEKSAFMARMSHDLRTPMNAVLGYAQLLQLDRSEPLAPRQGEHVAQIERAGRQLMTMIDALLEVSQRELETAPQRPAGGLHVLCVEDNPVNLQLVRELIALRPQVQLRTAVDGLSGVQAALAERPDLVLLDLELPDIDGIEVMRRLRGQASMAGCRIVALSADAMPGHIEAALAAGFDDYWTKPIQFDAFLGHIDRMAAERDFTPRG